MAFGGNGAPTEMDIIMSCDLIFDPKVFQPSEAAILREATRQAIKAVGAPDEHERQLVASDVMRVARSGYARSASGEFDATALAEAAALRFKALKRRRLAS